MENLCDPIVFYIHYLCFLLSLFIICHYSSIMIMLDLFNEKEYNELINKDTFDYDIKTMTDYYNEKVINDILSCFIFNVKEIIDRFEYKIYKDQDTNNYFMSINITHLFSTIILDRSNGFYHLHKDNKVFKSGLLSLDSLDKIDVLIDIEEKYQFTQKIINYNKDNSLENKPQLKNM